MKRKISCKKLIISIILIFVAVFLDQWSKIEIVDYFQNTYKFLYINKYLNIVFTINYGISFGILADQELNYLIFALLAILAVIFLLYWLWTNNKSVVNVALSFVIGGAVGNIIDRIRYGGVIDFIDLHWFNYHWPAFNIADCFVVVGICILSVEMFIKCKEEEKC